MPWIRRQLRGNLVFVKSDKTGNPAPGSDGRVDILYKLLPGAKVYRASVRNLESTGDPADDELLEDLPEPAPDENAAPPASGDDIIVWTDGACTGNPGPMGLGAVIIDGDERVELSEFLGNGTNNIAELTAILRALETIVGDNRRRPVVIHSDSTYSIGLLSKGWKAKANQQLVATIRAELTKFSDVRFVKVKGHAGIPENERCDELATSAIERRP